MSNDWLDKHIKEQRDYYGPALSRLISDVAEAIEYYGDDALEREYDGHDIVTSDDEASEHQESIAMKNTSLYLPIMDKRIRLVEVVFRPNDDKTYVYKSEHPIEVGDKVIVEARDWYAIATVTKIDLPIPMHDESTRYRWVVQTLHEADHIALLEYEQQVIDQVNKLRADNAREQMLGALGLTQDSATLILDHAVNDDATRTEEA